MKKDARFTNEIKSNIAKTKAAFYKVFPWSELGDKFKEETSELLNFVSQLRVVRQLGHFRK